MIDIRPCRTKCAVLGFAALPRVRSTGVARHLQTTPR